MKWNCDECDEEFDLVIKGPCAIALAYCEPCGKKLIESSPQLKEYLEELKDKEQDEN